MSRMVIWRHAYPVPPLRASANIPPVPPTKDKKKTTWLRVLVGVVCFLSVLTTLQMVRVQPPRAAQSVQIITSDWDPYVDTNSEMGGIVGEIVVSVLGSTGYDAQVTFDTWSGGLNKVNQGTAFGIFPMVKSADRQETFEYSDPLVEYTYVLFKRGGVELSDEVTAGDLSSVRVGKIAGYDYWPELENSRAQFVEYPSTLAGFAALRDGDIDFLAESDLVGTATLRSADFRGDIAAFEIVSETHPVFSSTDSVHFLVRKSELSGPFMERFNESLQEFKLTDRYMRQVEELRGVPDSVFLVGTGLVDVFDSSGAQIGSIPPGVEARVLTWPDELSAGQEVVVKLMNGPLAGRIGRVALDHVEVGRHGD